MRFLTSFTAVALLILVGGCVRTTQPILTDDQLQMDKSLLGKWVSKEGNESVDIQQHEQEKAYKFLYTDKDGKKGMLRARLGKIGDLMVAELTADDPAAGATDVYKVHLLPLYSFLVIDQTTPRLVFRTMAPDWLKKYVAAHPNELQVFKPDSDSLIVTSPTADVQAFLLHHWKDEGAASEPETYARPGDPTTRAAP